MMISTESRCHYETMSKINENDPRQLRAIIDSLIEKSKTLIVNLQQTLTKLQQMQKQRDFWKNQYFNFRDACNKYSEDKGLDKLQHVSFLQHKIKSIEIENICLSEKFAETMTRSCKNISTIYQFNSIQKKKQEKYNKSTSTVSYSRDSPYQQKIGPKKIQLFKTESRKNSGNNKFKF